MKGDHPSSKLVEDWAERLEQDGLARLATTEGPSSITLRVRLVDEEAGPVTLWQSNSGVALTFWGSVLLRRAPGSIPAIERAAAKSLKPSDNYVNRDEITPALLEALTAAYQEAYSV